MTINFTQDIDKAIAVMYNAARWLEDSGLKPSKWWRPQNMNRDFLLRYTEPDEYYVVLIDGQPAASMVLQETERNQSWQTVDGNKPQKALYLHWLCVHRDFAGKNLPQHMVDFSQKLAKKKKIKFLRVDCNADEIKLREVYERLGFKLIKIVKEEYRRTAFYHKSF